MFYSVFQAAKATKYANYQKLCDIVFAFFTILWIITRTGIFPFYIIWRYVKETKALASILEFRKVLCWDQCFFFIIKAY